MITFIILLILAITTFIGAKKAEDCSKLEILSVKACMIFTLWLTFHTVCWLTTSYNFNKLVVKREVFVESLIESRKSGMGLESATILKEISDFNQNLASEKYDNKIWFLEQYIDDRIETLEPIK